MWKFLLAFGQFAPAIDAMTAGSISSKATFSLEFEDFAATSLTPTAAGYNNVALGRGLLNFQVTEHLDQSAGIVLKVSSGDQTIITETGAASSVDFSFDRCNQFISNIQSTDGRAPALLGCKGGSANPADSWYIKFLPNGLPTSATVTIEFFMVTYRPVDENGIVALTVDILQDITNDSIEQHSLTSHDLPNVGWEVATSSPASLQLMTKGSLDEPENVCIFYFSEIVSINYLLNFHFVRF